MIELRWLCMAGKPPVLQYRYKYNYGTPPGVWSEWQETPMVFADPNGKELQGMFVSKG